MVIIAKYAHRMQKHFGSTDCSAIHPQVMGRYYDLSDIKENAKFHTEGADQACKKVIEYGIRTACDLMLNDDGSFKDR